MKIWDVGRAATATPPVAETDPLWPCSKVWGMGFAWSSFVAQETLLGVCERAGLLNRVALAVGHPVPGSERVFFSLAIDDVMIFSRHGPGHTAAAAQLLDVAMAEAGIVKHPGKDINDSTDLTCNGVDLVDGRWWWPPASKMWQLLMGTVALCTSRRGSSAALRAFHGLIQWFDLLQRGKFAFYDSVYRESEAWDDWTVRNLPSDVLRELACSITLGSMWGVDMGISHLPFIAATDASSEYGLGGCTAPRTLASMSALASLAERDGTYVTLTGVTDKPRTRSLGSPHNLGIGLSEFTSIFSIRCHDDDHINIRECKALLFYVRWLLRSTARHRHRVIVLVDSKVVVGAVTKGRSGSRLLNGWVRRIHCLCFAGGIRLMLIYVPSEHNPSDYPSRGVRLPGRRMRPALCTRCPDCGERPEDHPRHVPKRLRGRGLACTTADGWGHAYIEGDWVPQIDLDVERIISIKQIKRTLRFIFQGWVEVIGVNHEVDSPCPSV